VLQHTHDLAKIISIGQDDDRSPVEFFRQALHFSNQDWIISFPASDTEKNGLNPGMGVGTIMPVINATNGANLHFEATPYQRLG
jgi:hypothetical protein